MDRLYAVRTKVIALTLALAVLGAVCTGSGVFAQEASAQAAEGDRLKIGELEYVDVNGGSVKLVDHPSYVVLPGYLPALTGHVNERFVQPGKWYEVRLDEQYRVIDVKGIARPAGAGLTTTLSPQEKELVGKFATFKPGDKIEIEVTVPGRPAELIIGVFVQYDSNGLVIKVGDKEPLYSLRQIKHARQLDSGTGVGPATDVREKAIKTGNWYRVNDEFYGLCWGGKAGEVIDLELHPSGERRKFHWPFKLEDAAAPKISLGTGPSGSTGTVGPADENPVTLKPKDDSQLDWTANEWRFPVVIHQNYEGKIIVNARIEATFKGHGTFVTPAKEKEILLQPEWRDDKRSAFSFLYADSRHFLQRNEAGDACVISELDEKATVKVSQAAPAALFPGTEIDAEVRVNLFDPSPTDGPRLKFDKVKNVIPFSDKRALQFLVKAFTEGKKELREKILAAFEKSANPDIVPFLLHRLYIDEGAEDNPKIKKAIATMRDSGAEEYLVTLVREEGYKKEFTIPSASGGTEKTRPPASPNAVLVIVIELLELMQSDRAAKLVLPFIRSQDEGLRDAARRFFLRRGPVMVGTLVRLLSGSLADLAKEMLRELTRGSEPECVWLYLRDVQKVKDADHESKRDGLPPDQVGELDVEFAAKWAKSRSDVPEDDEIARAREILQRIGAAKKEVEALRVDLSIEYQTQAGRLGSSGDKGEVRPRRVRLLQRAILLNPKNNDARGALAAAYLEVANEIRNGGQLRSGPGDLYRALRPLKMNEILSPMTVPEGDPTSPDFRFVKGEDQMVGWVHATLVKEGKTSLHVNLERRPIKFALTYGNLARAIAPDRGERIERAIAEMTAIEADEWAAAGDLDAAYEKYKIAAALDPTNAGYASKRFEYYLKSRPLIPASAVLALVVLLATAFIRPKPPRIMSALPPQKAAATRKVPS